MENGTKWKKMDTCNMGKQYKTWNMEKWNIEKWKTWKMEKWKCEKMKKWKDGTME